MVEDMILPNNRLYEFKLTQLVEMRGPERVW